MANKIEIKNKKAAFQFEFIDTYTAGIQLKGTEIKSIRLGKASLVDSYCHFKNNELFIKGMYIDEYEFGNINNHDPRRERKLLLNRYELKKLKRSVDEKGMTIVATKLFLKDNQLAKLEISLAKGKHLADKREDIKEKDMKRDMERIDKYRY